jgi:SAM-dependent methyltransferase
MRHRALLLYMRDVLRLPSSGGDVLHVAAEPSLGDWLAAIDSVRYLPVDIDPAPGSLRADITDLPFAKASFDLIVCLHVLEHVVDDRRAIRELFRVLRPGGKAVIQVPPSSLDTTFEDATVSTPRERERVFGQYDHVRICGADYRLRLEDAGFDVSSEDYVERLDPDTRLKFGLRTGEPFFLCAK